MKEFFSPERFLRQAISVRRAVVIACAATMVTGAVWWLVPGDELSHRWCLSIIAMVAFPPLAVASVIDSRIKIIPDPLVLVSVIAALWCRLGLALWSFSSPSQRWRLVITPVACALVVLALGHSVHLLAGLGRGDVKMAVAIAVWLGEPILVCTALWGGVCASGVWIVYRLICGHMTHNDTVALGPWLAGSAWTVCMVAVVP